MLCYHIQYRTFNILYIIYYLLFFNLLTVLSIEMSDFKYANGTKKKLIILSYKINLTIVVAIIRGSEPTEIS